MWGKSKIDEYKAAWFNVLAAEAYREARSCTQAGGYFHFAAHAFRGVGEYAIAGSCYCESAKQFKQAGDKKNALRACQRGIACFREVCDDSDPVYTELVQIRKDMMSNGTEQTP